MKLPTPAQIPTPTLLLTLNPNSPGWGLQSDQGSQGGRAAWGPSQLPAHRGATLPGAIAEMALRLVWPSGALATRVQSQGCPC